LKNTSEKYGESLGFIETRTLTGAIEASDAMVKTARVKLLNNFRIGGALVTVVVQGELAACMAAVDAGKAAAERVGELIASHVIARPFRDTDDLVLSMISEKKDPGNKKENIKEEQPDLENRIITNLKETNGVTVNRLSELTGTDLAETRKALKKLIDEKRVEKLGSKYFIL
jgi:ethanolamine utilization protein EutM